MENSAGFIGALLLAAITGAAGFGVGHIKGRDSAPEYVELERERDLQTERDLAEWEAAESQDPKDRYELCERFMYDLELMIDEERDEMEYRLHTDETKSP